MFSIGTHTTVKVRLQEIVGGDRSLRKYQTSIDGTIPFMSEVHFRSHDVLWQGQMKSNEGFLGEGFPPCFGRWWRCGQNITHWALLLATLFWCSLPFLKQRSTIFFEIGIENWQISSLPCLCCVRTVSWYARASVCSLQCGQLYNWLFHLNIMSSLVWKKNRQFFAGVNDTSVVTHKQTFSREACTIKKRNCHFYKLSWAFRSAPARQFSFTGVSHGSGFLISIDPAANGNGLLPGFLSGNRRPPFTVRMIGRGHR